MMVVEKSIHVVFDELHFSTDVEDDLAKKVDKININDEFYKKTRESDREDNGTK